MKFYFIRRHLGLSLNFRRTFRFIKSLTPEFISKLFYPFSYSEVPAEDPSNLSPDLVTGPQPKMDSTVVGIISDPKGFSCNSIGAASSSNANYGTLQLSSSSDLHREMRRRGHTAPRSVTKNGDTHVEARNIELQSRKFIGDAFTTLLELRWRWTLLIFCLSYFGSWTIFAVFWYAILYFHGDFEHFGEEGWTPCVSGIHTFGAAFLFSVETQHTTGYGFYKLSDHCSPAIILMCFQSIAGVLLEGLLVGLVFVKMSRAKKRNKTLLFSRSAVICQRDGQLCLMFRVADMRTKTHIIQAKVRAQIIRKKTTLEGEVIPFHQEELKVRGDEEKDGKILLFWPTTMVHDIDSSSPLYHLSPSDLNLHNWSFEIVVVLEGIVETTGLTTQARSSYLASEILWGHRFESLFSSSKASMSGERLVDYSLFHSTYPVTTTTLSAAELDSSISKS